MATATTIERMGEALHLWALAPATVGACCVAADRGRARVPEFAAAALMLLAMADAATGAGLIAPVFWAVLLVAAAMALAALRGTRRGPRGEAPAGGGVGSRVGGIGSRARVGGSGGGVGVAAGVRMPHPSRAMTLMTALGLIVMAVLMVAMTGHGVGSGGGTLAGSVAAHGHGAGLSVLGAGAAAAGGAGAAVAVATAAVAFAIAYAAASALAAARTGIRLDRIQYASMAAATGLMALASAA